MTYVYYFEKLDVWQLTRKLILDIYDVTSKFPSEEKFGMVSQIRRSAVSVASNLAEGSSRSTKKDQANFTTMSYSSLMELLNQLIISVDLGMIEEETYIKLRERVQEISNKLNALRKSQLANSTNTQIPNTK